MDASTLVWTSLRRQPAEMERDHARALADTIGLLFRHLADLPCEIFGYALLSPEWRLLGWGHGAPGGADGAAVPLTEIAWQAALVDARWVALAHNHPSGAARPSAQDIRVTRRIARALAGSGTLLVDHVVLAKGGGCTSFRGAGLL